MDGLPLMIPDGAWKRLTTLTSGQQAQLTALQTSLYSDQLAAINSMTNQAQTLRAALVAAKQAGGQSDTVTKLQGQILDLTAPLLQRYDQFVRQVVALLQPAQQAELTTVANQIVAQERQNASLGQAGLSTTAQMSSALLSKLGPIELIDANEDDDKDGMPTLWELQYGLNALDSSDAGVDTDGDGLVNYMEYLLNSDPQNPDDPGSGLSIDWRTKLGLRSANPAKTNADNSGGQGGLGISPLTGVGGTGMISTNALSTTNSIALTNISVQIISPASGTVVK